MFERPVIVFPIGPPASGKSTLGDLFKAGNGRDRINSVVSPDEWREKLCGTRSNQTMNHRIFEICNLIAMGRMETGLDVWFDATNMHSPSIRELSLWADVYDVQVINVLMTASDEECTARNLARADRGAEVVPQNIMEAFFVKRSNLNVDILRGITIADTTFLKMLEEQ